MKMRVEMGGPIEAEELFCVGPDGRCYPYRTVLIVGRALESTDGGVIDAEVFPVPMFSSCDMLDSHECATAAQDIKPGEMVTGDMLRSEPKPTLAEAIRVITEHVSGDGPEAFEMNMSGMTIGYILVGYGTNVRAALANITLNVPEPQKAEPEPDWPKQPSKIDADGIRMWSRGWASFVTAKLISPGVWIVRLQLGTNGTDISHGTAESAVESVRVLLGGAP